MSKQFTVNISPLQQFALFNFISGTVQPKNRDEARKLKGVFETFGLDAIQDRVDALADGERISSKDFAKDAQPIETGSVDLNTLLGYLDAPMPNVGSALLLLDISDELLRAKEGKPKLESVPEGA